MNRKALAILTLCTFLLSMAYQVNAAEMEETILGDEIVVVEEETLPDDAENVEVIIPEPVEEESLPAYEEADESNQDAFIPEETFIEEFVPEETVIEEFSQEEFDSEESTEVPVEDTEANSEVETEEKITDGPDENEDPSEEEETLEPYYSLCAPNNIPVVFGSGECLMDAVSIPESGGFANDAFVSVTLDYDGIFASSTTDSVIPYSIHAVFADGSCQWIPSGNCLVFPAMGDGALGIYGIWQDAEVVNFLLQFPDGAWDNLAPGDYTTSIHFWDAISE